MPVPQKLGTEEPIRLVFASDDHYAPGLFVTVGSTLDAYRGSRPIEVHVLDTGLSVRVKAQLEQMSERRGFRLTIHVPDLNVFSSLTKDYGGGVSAYARLLVGRMLDVSRLIYIDTDVLVLKDIGSIIDMDMGNSILMATRDRAGGEYIPNVLARDCPFESNPAFENTPYFNTGFILFDLAKWKREEYERKCLDLLAGFHGRLRAWDQTVLNYVCRGRIGELPHGWLSDTDQEPGVPMTERNYHFIGKRKPWMGPVFSLPPLLVALLSTPDQTVSHVSSVVPEQVVHRSLASAIRVVSVSPRFCRGRNQAGHGTPGGGMPPRTQGRRGRSRLRFQAENDERFQDCIQNSCSKMETIAQSSLTDKDSTFAI